MAFDNSVFPYAVPTVGVTVGPTYATDINNILNTLIAAWSLRLTPAQLNFNQSTDVNGQKLLSIGAAAFQSRSSLDTGLPNSLQVVNGELYWYDAAGHVLQVTVGGVLNAAALGGIVGDYGGGFPANLVTCVQASNKYSFVTASPSNYSLLQCLGLIMTNGSGNTAQLSAPASLTNHTATWLGSLPSSGTKMLSITSAGAMGHAGVVDAFSLASNQDITLQGSGKLKHGNYEYKQQLSGGDAESGTPGFQASAWTLATSGDSVVCDLANGLVIPARIVSVRLYTRKTAAGTMTITVERVNGDGTITVLQTATRVDTTGRLATTVTLGAPEVIAQDRRYFVRVAVNYSSASSEWIDLSATIDQN